MTRKVKIMDAETGRVLRETYVEEPSKVLGMFTPADIAKGASFLVVAAIFLINLDNAQKSNQATLARLVDFRDNSDSFQTTVYGTRFRNGEPIDANFKVTK